MTGCANENMAKVLAAKGYHYQFCFRPERRAHGRRGKTTNAARSLGMVVEGLQAVNKVTYE